MSNKRFIIQRFRFPKILTCQGYLTIRAAGGMKRVQISCDICTRFARYLYSTKLCWIIKYDNANFILNNPKHAGSARLANKQVEVTEHKLADLRLFCSVPVGWLCKMQSLVGFGFQFV